MKELKEKVKLVREMVNDINTLTNELEGVGCDIHIHCNEPYNKIDFIVIEQTIKL